MRKIIFWIIAFVFFCSCTSQKELAYLRNLPAGESTFTMSVPEYKLQPRDMLYITIKAMNPDGNIVDFFSTARSSSSASSILSESGGFLYSYDINSEGYIQLPAIGKIKVIGNTVEEARENIQREVDKVFRYATVECKLLNFKFTVIGEVRVPGSYINYNNYLTVFEAIGRAGGISDFGKRDTIIVIRSTLDGTKTFNLNLQDKNLLSSEAYFLLPNDVVIVQTGQKKIFNLNLPTFSFMTSLITTTILLLNFFK